MKQSRPDTPFADAHCFHHLPVGVHHADEVDAVGEVGYVVFATEGGIKGAHPLAEDVGNPKLLDKGVAGDGHVVRDGIGVNAQLVFVGFGNRSQSVYGNEIVGGVQKNFGVGEVIKVYANVCGAGLSDWENVKLKLGTITRQHDDGSVWYSVPKINVGGVGGEVAGILIADGKAPAVGGFVHDDFPAEVDGLAGIVFQSHPKSEVVIGIAEVKVHVGINGVWGHIKV